jgi:hypothetical protein
MKIPVIIALVACVLLADARPAFASEPDKHADPYTASQWCPSEAEIAFIAKKDLLMIQTAIKFYALEFKKAENDPVAFEDVK